VLTYSYESTTVKQKSVAEERGHSYSS